MPERHNFLLVMVFIASIFASDAQRRVPAGFTGVRGKKFDAEGASPPETLEKRAPSGFMGMRGKKYTFDGELTPEWTYKRAPNGFVGMRGKKEDFSQDFPDEQLKRSPQGFLGMRGKKYDDYELLDDYPKRTPIGFTGLRGKKVIFEKRAPTALGFFGTRGKKYPYEFRGKFVGVRGKKSEGAGRVVDVGDDLDLNQLMLLLTNETGGEKERVVLE